MAMKRALLVSILATVVLLAGHASAQAAWVALPGRPGVSYVYGSGWIDLDQQRDFMRGDTIRLTVGGSAHQVLVRFLPKDASADDAVGIDGTATVPTVHLLFPLVLTQDHPNTRQISVHGSPNPWGKFDLGTDNGSASLLAVELLLH